MESWVLDQLFKLAQFSVALLAKDFQVCIIVMSLRYLFSLKKKNLAQFGFFATPKSVGEAELTLGGADTTKFNGSLTFISQPSSNGNWNLPSTGISVNGKTTTALNTRRTIIFDSGTSSMTLDKTTTEV